MTVGQRIAQKRKELGLSQEGLGEQLGVSRQAIYKWESDASLPEIDKLITLSRIFSVPVGWLLGVEEEPRDEAPSSGELTEAQLAMVREIVDRYLTAQPRAEPPKKRRFARFCAGLAAAALVVCLFNLFSKLDRVSQNYDSLRRAVNSVSSNVDYQISSITDRVEDILKSQNTLTAEWTTEPSSTDLEANTVTFDVRVVPRTYVEGMTAVFQARSGEDTVELPVEPGADHAFTGQVTCPLTDDISLTAVFVTGDRRETQWLEDYSSLYTASFPNLYLHSFLWNSEQDGVLLADRHLRPEVVNIKTSEENWRPDPPATLRVGLFQDRKLVSWYAEQDKEIIIYGPNSMSGKKSVERIWVLPRDITLDPGHEYCEAAVYTDEYGRQRIYTDIGFMYSETEGYWTSSRGDYESSCGPDGWEF